jgi:hypothetical protein
VATFADFDAAWTERASAQNGGATVEVTVAGQHWAIPTVTAAVMLRALRSLVASDDGVTGQEMYRIALTLIPERTIEQWLTAGLDPGELRQAVADVLVAQITTANHDEPGGRGQGSATEPSFVRTVLVRWRLLEADFTREYRLDINEAIHDMTWRRFAALVAGLSAASRWAGHLRSKAPKRPVRRLTEPKAIGSFMRSLRTPVRRKGG